jgi:hypothetical protein
MGERRRVASRVAIAATSVTLVLAACRQIVGIGDTPPTETNAPDAAHADAPSPEASADSGPPACGIAYPGAACGACVVSSCCREAMACASSASCAALEGCEAACGGDPTCRAQCAADHGFGNDPETAALAACLAAHCDGPCNTAGGGATDVVPPDAAAACQSCIVSHQCTAVTACAADPGCQSITRCIYSSHTFDTQGGCFADAGAEAGADFENTYVALQTSCARECALGTNWACVGKFTWPPNTAASTTVQVFLQDIVGGRPTAGATVSICSGADRSCANPFASGTTDSNGRLTLQPEAGAGGWQQGYLDISSPSIVHEVAFWTAPITTTLATLPTFSTATPGEIDAEAQSIPVVLDPTLGIVWVQASDCTLSAGIGVELAISPTTASTKLFYLDQNFVSSTLDATAASGRAVFVNVPAQMQLVLTGTPQGIGMPSATTGLFVRPGGLAFVMLPPTP